MFVQKLLMNPEEERRRRLRRARIVRRNRIKREVAQGLPVRVHRVPRSATPSNDQWESLDLPVSPFKPTFGGDGDDIRPPRSDMFYVPPKRFIEAPSSKQVKTRNRQERITPIPKVVDKVIPINDDEPKHDPPAAIDRPVSISTPQAAAAPARKINARVLKQWKDAVHRVLIRRHEEILSKDPNRKWRQERLGLLLFAEQEYADAADHLTKAITLGANSGACWRRLAQCHWRKWHQSGEWTSLWDCRCAYEQALTHIEVACNPFAIFEYAQALEVLGDYTDALAACSAILSTFPRFQQRKQVVFRYILLQRYQLFTSTAGNVDDSKTNGDQHTIVTEVATIDRQALLLQCIAYTKELLLDKDISEGDQAVELMYMHARLNELLVHESSSGKVAAISKASAAVALATTTADHCFEELLRLVVERQIISEKIIARKTPWRYRSETYTMFARYFQSRNQTIPASDALSRALELLDDPISSTTNGPSKSKENVEGRIELYLVLSRNYYQCNQMEKAIRSMEAVFDMNPFHEEARASLVQWFPEKWKYRLDLEDASQTQIARVIRGVWGRNMAHQLRKAAESWAESEYRAHPFSIQARRKALGLLRDKYAPLFFAQDVSARIIQQQARKYLRFARLKWARSNQQARVINELLSKYRTRKYRYNRRVRADLAKLLPEYEVKFIREEAAARLIQRHFRGYTVRRAYFILRDAQRAELRRMNGAADRIKSFLQWCCRKRRCRQLGIDKSIDEVISEAHQRVLRAKERLARRLQRCVRRRKMQLSNSFNLASAAMKSSILSRNQQLREVSARRIQRKWRQYVRLRYSSGTYCTANSLGNLVEYIRPGTGSTSARRSMAANRDQAARKIQGQYRRRTIRVSISKLRRIPAPLSVSAIQSLLATIDLNHFRGVESRARLMAIRSLEERQSLFESPVVVFQGSSEPVASDEDRPEEECDGIDEACINARHLTNAIQFSTVLRCLVCVSGYFFGAQILGMMKAIATSKQLRVLAFGAIYFEKHSSMGDNRSIGAIQALSRAVRTANFLLEELYFENNVLLSDAREGSALAEMIGDFFYARYGHLRYLVAARVSLSDANAELLASALSLNTVLQHLDLNGNRLSDSTAVAFATKGLPFNSTLKYLNLADNVIGSSGATALFQCLTSSNQSLETLILTNNNVQNDAVESLQTAWQSNAVLERVDLAGNLVHIDHLRDLSSASNERRAVAPSSAELRLFLARKRFTQNALLSPSRSVLGGSTASKSSERLGKRRPREVVALSPHRWLTAQQREQKPPSPIRSPVAVYKWQKQHQEQQTPASKPLAGKLKLRKSGVSNGERLPALTTRISW